jgi:hypothetical protein
MLDIANKWCFNSYVPPRALGKGNMQTMFWFGFVCGGTTAATTTSIYLVRKQRLAEKARLQRMWARNRFCR